MRPSTGPIIEREDPDKPEIRALLAEGDAYYAALYPAQSNHLLDISSLKDPQVRLYVARIDGAACGTGAIVRHDREHGEIKRMFVAPAARGHGLGRLLLERLEEDARSQGLSLLRLETGVKQPEARRLYEAAGYREIAHFYPYQPDPLSLFMEKGIAG